MQLTLIDNLPFSTITVTYKGVTAIIDKILVDTGSVTTILAVDVVAALNIIPEPQDTLHLIRGVGGTEVVFRRKLDALKLGEHGINDIEVEIGGMDYGFTINGILGMDFMIRTGVIINLKTMSIELAI